MKCILKTINAENKAANINKYSDVGRSERKNIDIMIRNITDGNAISITVVIGKYGRNPLSIITL